MPELTITLDPKDIARFRRMIRAHPMMAAKALTFTAERAVPAWRAGQAVFHRRNSWIDRGVRVTFATPSNLNAQVGSMDKFMARHVIGVDQPKVASSGRLFVPIQPIEEQGTHTQIRARLGRMMGTKTKPFMRHGVLMRRLGKGHDAPLKVLGVLRKSVNIKPRLDAERIVGEVVEREFPTIYERLIIKWAETGRA